MQLEALLANHVFQPARFYLAAGRQLRVEHVREDTCFWEVFHGHLLDATQTRETKTFQTWNVFVDSPGTESSSPVLAFKWDAKKGRIYVVRYILSHAWESYESQPRVIESRQVQKWLAELVASVHLRDNWTESSVSGLLSESVTRAVIGGSRLPITSWESPLPGFTFGELSYFPITCQGNQSLSDPAEVIEKWWGITEKHSTKTDSSGDAHTQSLVLETVLRSADASHMQLFSHQLHQRWLARGRTSSNLIQVVKTLFHRLSLSPYTQLVDNLTNLLRNWAKPDLLGPAAVVDLLSYILRHLVRHLNAYDLKVFHHFGANYPDALFLDAVLCDYLDLIQQYSNLFLAEPGESASLGAIRQRRRALRQAWQCRSQYEGHLVPDRPTSPGENQRVTPDGFAPVPDDQLVDPRMRHLRLYEHTPTDRLITSAAATVLELSLSDLAEMEERRELGMALFLDRPFGAGKLHGELDRTTLLSYTAFSESIARERWEWIREQHADLVHSGKSATSDNWNFTHQGFSASQLGQTTRRGVVALEDAVQAADDFVFLRTTHSSIQELLIHYDFSPLAPVLPQGSDPLLLIRTTPVGNLDRLELVAWGKDQKPLFQLEAPFDSMDEPPYVEVAGIEYLQGLRASHVTPQTGTSAKSSMHEVTGSAIRPRLPLG